MFLKCLLLLLAATFLSAGLVPAPENRIISGKDIKIEEAPWQVSLQLKGQHSCGGSIYSKEIIITAAHCFYENHILLKAKDFLVLVGSEYWRSRDTFVRVAAIKHHEEYLTKSQNISNDIGIMKLSNHLTFTTRVQRIPLATKNPAPQSAAWSTGWGQAIFFDIYNRPFSANPEILQGINIAINDLSSCKVDVPWMAKGTICAGTRGSSACTGDSGGPLVVNNELVGVVSASALGCRSSGVYTSVAYFHKWILSSIKAI